MGPKTLFSCIRGFEGAPKLQTQAERLLTEMAREHPVSFGAGGGQEACMAAEGVDICVILQGRIHIAWSLRGRRCSKVLTKSA